MTDTIDRAGSVTRHDYVPTAEPGGAIVAYVVNGLERGHKLRRHGRIDFQLSVGVVDVVNGYGNHIEYCATFTQEREWCNLCGLGAGEHFHRYSRGTVIIGQSQQDDLEQAIRDAANRALNYD